MTGNSRPFNMTPTVQLAESTKKDYIDEEDMEKRPLKRKRHHPSDSLTTDRSYPTTMNLPHKMTSQRSVPAFLHKLFNMVGDPSTNQLVRWSKNGNSFLVEGHERFAKHVLPRFYKHNTFASFVRQLNMYDFHKVPHLQQGALLSNTGVENEVWEFSHPHFQRNRPDLLVLVSRKRNRDRDKSSSDQMNLGSLVKEITAIRKHQANITADLRNLHHDNEIIWQETLAAREKFQNHQQVISKILQFLSAVFSDDQNTLYELSHQKDFLSDTPLQLQNHKGKAKNKFNKFVANHGPSSHRSPLSQKGSDRQFANSDNRALSNDSGIGSADSSSSSSSSNNSSEDDAKTSKVPFKDLPTTEQRPAPPPQIDSKFFSNNTARSAEAITSDIDELQEDVELLAAQLGINPLNLANRLNEVEKFSDDHVNMISSASRDDKMQLFKMADEDSQRKHTPQLLEHTYPVPNDFLLQSYHLHSPHHQFIQHALKPDRRHPSNTTATGSSNTNMTQQPIVDTNHVPAYVPTQSLTPGSLPIHQPLTADSNITMNPLFDPSFRQRSSGYHSEQATINPEFCHTDSMYRHRYVDYMPYYDTPSSVPPPAPLLQQESNSLHSSIIAPTQPFDLMCTTAHMDASPSPSPAQMQDTGVSNTDQDK